MDRPPHDYAAAMSYAHQPPQQPYGYPPPPPQQQQFHGGSTPPPPQYLPPPHPSMPPQFQYHHHHAPPHLLHLQHQQQPPPPPQPSFPPHLPPPPHPHFHHGHFDTPPPPQAPPSDPELHKRIDKLVEYSAKNGPEFEAMIREKQKDNPEYAFLFGGDGHAYYRHKLWLSVRPYNSPYNHHHHSHHPSPPPPQPLPIRSPLPPMMHQPHPAPPYFYPWGPPPPSAPEYDQQAAGKPYKGLPGPLPGDVATELGGVLAGLNGTKESIKGAKFWFVQRSVFAPTLAEALRERVFGLDDSERQLHVIYLVNDILFESLHRRTSDELDNESLAFKPVLGSMLARIYHHPHIQEDSQSKLQQLLQLWASNNIYDQDTINALRNEMVTGQSPHSFPGPPKELLSTGTIDSTPGSLPPTAIHNLSQWHPQNAAPNFSDQDHPDKLAGAPLFSASAQPPPPTNQLPPPLLPGQPSTGTLEKVPPYPLFPPGLIPGMVRKMQIGSGVPYSPMSPLDIPTIIPPSSVSQHETLDRVAKFFKEIGEVNPLRSDGGDCPDRRDGDDDDDDNHNEDEYYSQREPVDRKGGARIPPPLNLQVDPETGTYPDGSVERKPGFGSSGRLGLGAAANPNEISQYDDVYTSYRKQRSTNYHSSMSSRATTTTTTTTR